MKNLIHLSLCGLALFLISCNTLNSKKEETLTPEDFETVEINNQYKISLPKYMTKADNLNEEASLQFQNVFKETYIVVIDESRQEFIDAFADLSLYDTLLSVAENYRDVQLGMIEENLTVNWKSTPEAFKIRGLDAQQVELDAHIEGVEKEISYLFTFVEGKDQVYMIMIWTLKDRKEKYFKTFKETAKSFELL